jgi:hypothetical protein
VRAVKAVRRSMARDQGLRRGYVGLCVSGVVMAVLAGSWRGGWERGGVGIGVLVLVLTRFGGEGVGGGMQGNGVQGSGIQGGWIQGMVLKSWSLLFSIILLLPYSGFQIPYHPLLVKLYSPPIQILLLRLGTLFLVSLFAGDISRIVRLKRDQWDRIHREEEQRREKVRGIFYTPMKKSSSERGSGRGGRLASGFGGGSRAGGFGMGGGRQIGKPMGEGYSRKGLFALS